MWPKYKPTRKSLMHNRHSASSIVHPVCAASAPHNSYAVLVERMVSTPDYHRALSLWVNEPTRKNIACLIKHNLSNGCSMIYNTVMNIVVTVGSAWWLLMAWRLFGARPLATIIMKLTNQHMSGTHQCIYQELHVFDLRTAQVYCFAIFLTCWHPSHITISFLL